MSAILHRPGSAADVPDTAPPSIAAMTAHLRAMREAGTLSPVGARLLARAEAFEEATREMAAAQTRLDALLKEIEEDTEVARKGLH